MASGPKSANGWCRAGGIPATVTGLEVSAVVAGNDLLGPSLPESGCRLFPYHTSSKDFSTSREDTSTAQGRLGSPVATMPTTPG